MRSVLKTSEADARRLIATLVREREGETLVVRTIDTYRASGKITLQLPRDPHAEALYMEPPRIQPGGITEIVTYVRVADATVREVTFLADEVLRDVELQLRPVGLQDI